MAHHSSPRVRISLLLAMAGLAVCAPLLPAQDKPGAAPADSAKPPAKAITRPRAGDRIEYLTDDSNWRWGTVQLLQRDGIVVKLDRSSETEKKPWNQVRWPGSDQTFETLQPDYKAPTKPQADAQKPSSDTDSQTSPYADLPALTKPRPGDKVEVSDNSSWWSPAVVQLIQNDGITVRDQWNKTQKKKWAQVRKLGDPRTYEPLAPDYQPVAIENIRPGDEVEIYRDKRWDKTKIVAILPTGMLVEGWGSDIASYNWSHLRWPGSTVTYEHLKDAYKPGKPFYDQTLPGAPKPGDQVQIKQYGRWETATLIAVLKETVISSKADKLIQTSWEDTRSLDAIQPFKITLTSRPTPGPGAPTPATGATPSASAPPQTSAVAFPHGFKTGSQVTVVRAINGQTHENSASLISATPELIKVKLHGQEEQYHWDMVKDPQTERTFKSMQAGTPYFYPRNQRIQYGPSNYSLTWGVVVKDDRSDIRIVVRPEGQAEHTTVLRTWIVTPPQRPAALADAVIIPSAAENLRRWERDGEVNLAGPAVPLTSNPASLRLPPLDAQWDPAGKIFASQAHPIVSVAFESVDKSSCRLTRLDLNKPTSDPGVTFTLQGAKRVLDVSPDGKKALTYSSGCLVIWDLAPTGATATLTMGVDGPDDTMDENEKVYFLQRNLILLVAADRQSARIVDTGTRTTLWKYKASSEFSLEPSPLRDYLIYKTSRDFSIVNFAGAVVFTSEEDFTVNHAGDGLLMAYKEGCFGTYALKNKQHTFYNTGQSGIKGNLRAIHPEFVLLNATDVVSMKRALLVARFSEPLSKEPICYGLLWTLRTTSLSTPTLEARPVITLQMIQAEGMNTAHLREIPRGSTVNVQFTFADIPREMETKIQADVMARSAAAGVNLVSGANSPFKLVIESRLLPPIQHRIHIASMNLRQEIDVQVRPIHHGFTLTKDTRIIAQNKQVYGNSLVTGNAWDNNTYKRIYDQGAAQSYLYFEKNPIGLDTLIPIQKTVIPVTPAPVANPAPSRP